MVFIRAEFDLDFMKSRGEKRNSLKIWNLDDFPYVILEAIICAVCPMPFITGYSFNYLPEPIEREIFMEINNLLTLIMHLRIIYLIRSILSFSSWHSSRSRRVCNLYAKKADYLFSLKCIMKTSPSFFVLISFCVSCFYFGYAIRICEAPIDRPYKDSTGNIVKPTPSLSVLSNCIWLAIVTMTTVGYGDFSTKTNLGRIVSFFCSCWGTFIVSLIIVTLTDYLTPDKLENNVISM